jgi:hypothetical protein
LNSPSAKGRHLACLAVTLPRDLAGFAQRSCPDFNRSR